MSHGMFTPEDFAHQQAHSRASADVVMPLVLHVTGAKSIVDIGCGVGTWLAACVELGIADYLGLDGDYAATILQIPQSHFQTADLTKPVTISRRTGFDLAMSLEVAEHLPAEIAPRFVRDLTNVAPQVLFSAAVPGQGGVGHINERWLSYWADLFKAQGYFPVDTLRPQLWTREEVAWWYRQNLMLFVKQDRLPATYTPPAMLDLVHPGLLTEAVTRLQEAEHRYIGGREALMTILGSLLRRLGLGNRSDDGR